MRRKICLSMVPFLPCIQAPKILVVAANQRSVPTAVLGAMPNIRIMMGAIRDPPPTPVRPTSAPTPNPAAQLIQFIVISTLVVHASVSYRTDGHRRIPYMKWSIKFVAFHYADSVAVVQRDYADWVVNTDRCNAVY